MARNLSCFKTGCGRLQAEFDFKFDVITESESRAEPDGILASDEEDCILPAQVSRLNDRPTRRFHIAMLAQALADIEATYDALDIAPEKRTDKHRWLIYRQAEVEGWFFDDDCMTWVPSFQLSPSGNVWVDGKNPVPLPRQRLVWYFSEPRFDPFTFKEICAVLRFSPVALRRAVDKWARLRRAGIRSVIGIYKAGKKREV